MRNAPITLLLLAALGTVLLPEGRADSRHFEFTIETATRDVRVDPTPGAAGVRIDPAHAAGFTTLQDENQPSLPFRIVSVIVPRGERVSGVSAVSTASTAAARDVVLAPFLASAPEPAPDTPAPVAPSGKQRVPIAPAAVHGVFPSELVRYLGTGTLHGYRIASFAVFPVRSERGDVIVHERIALRVETAPDIVTGVEPVRARRMAPSAYAQVRAELDATALNPETAASYPEITQTPPRGAFSPSTVPSTDGSPVEYVIVTTTEMEASFQVLADWKTAKGVPTVVKTTDWILAHYRRGSDMQETIRTFLQDAYEDWGIRYALIAADTPEIPARYLYSYYYYGGTDIPTDIYYAGLDGTFNADGDTRFGEFGVDAPDLYTELNVARLPVSDAEDADIVIGKIMQYEIAPDSSYTDKIMFLAEVLFPAPWSPGMTIYQNGADIAQYVNTLWVADPSRRVTRCYETDYLFAGSVFESRAIAIDSLEAGYNHVFHIGHGFRFNMHCGDGNVAIPDADALHNPGRYFNLFMLNCTAAAFDYDCLGEHFLRNPNGGAVSVVGAANSAFADASAYYMANYADQLYKKNKTHIGETLSLSRAVRTPLAMVDDNIDFWTHYIYATLADPEMPQWTGPLRTPTVSVIDSVVAGTNEIVVNVEVGGASEDSALVCLWKPGEDYQLVQTNASGDAVFSFTTPTPGPISLVITGLNLSVYADTIDVHPAPGALLTVSDVTVDDDSNDGTSGNGDGVIDAGETVDLIPVFTNTGGAPSALSSSALSSTDSLVTVLDATVSVPALLPAGAGAAPDAWRVVASPAAGDGHILRFTVVTSAGLSNWPSGFALPVRTPGLEVTGLRKSDALPVGNGDGVIVPGESFLLYCALKNYGSGNATGLTAVLRATDAGSTVIDSVSGYPDLGPLAQSENLVGFKLSEANVAIENGLELEITDAAGRTITHEIELRIPLAPTIQTFDASLGIDRMVVTWTPGGSTDVLGYRVYRSTASGGPFVLASPDIVHHTTFTDAGLSPSTRYYYRVSTIDAAGNESALSPVAASSTNPPQLAGWPNELVDPSANSPAIGDVNADGLPDIVVGNDRVYAFKPDGGEIINGDGQGVTWGVLSGAGDGFIGPAALAKIDDIPGLEVVAAAYVSKEVYIFNRSGETLPGWPQPTIDLIRGGMCVGDIDGDGDLEIVGVDQEAYLYAWHHDGTEVRDGDANPATAGVFKRLPDTNQWQYQMPALADLDGDDKEEIIIATQDKKLYVFNEDGSDLTGWPRTLPNYAGGGVAIGDIDNNGDLEIVVTVRSSGETYAINHDNTLMWTRWLQHNLFFNPSPALADITGDGNLEVIIPTSNGRVYAIQYNGTDAPGWPVVYSTSTYTESSPLVADVDGDGSVDILLGDEAKFINAWSSTGVPIDGFPLVTKDAIRGTPAVMDLDRDGDVEVIVVGYDKSVYVWDLPAPYDPALAPWPMYHANVHRNAVYGVEIATPVEERPRSLATSLLQNYPNPFNPSTTIAYSLSDGAARPVSLVIYDVRGARVRTLVNRTLAAGHHTAAWDGRNDAGTQTSSGVYFYRLVTPEHTLTRKMVLLK